MHDLNEELLMEARRRHWRQVREADRENDWPEPWIPPWWPLRYLSPGRCMVLLLSVTLVVWAMRAG